jgi:tRNA modification GTPase
VVHNKIDIRGTAADSTRLGDALHVWLSARSRTGLELLVEALKQLAGQSEDPAGAFTARARHVAALERAQEHFDAATRVLVADSAGELAAEELRSVQRALGEITGEFSNDDLLGEIFASFCIGK